MTNSKSSTEEKNKAFEKMQNLNQNRGEEESLEKKIKDAFNLKSFVKINESDVLVVIDSTKHDKKLANQIMKKVGEEFENPVNVTVKFQK